MASAGSACAHTRTEGIIAATAIIVKTVILLNIPRLSLLRVSVIAHGRRNNIPTL
ncbi:hypothetical protein ACP_0865 [Acidobacterium capsulatum ATCC 51196]|uniref:Uncharacterized protein n=1 Tax=Acidobacterium capsulatum (strain ATCC 51196 / DSM 11244 / BCRC 80197 / JCM 7670 / NBRC 15755 / NCIMB 13165 / 161) TaxID=240015 RepID=C1F2W4_ACIC5|nr:hypothetical protein ACP_0865 [Acidobacterium capsulatum ATCC 51196]